MSSKEANYKYLLIPASLCYFSLQNRLARAFQIYLWLKMNRSGKCQLDHHTLSMLREALELESDKTIMTGINKLIKLGWIGHNEASDYYFIRGFDYLRLLYNNPSRVSAVYIERDLLSLKGFLFGVLIGNLIKNQEGKRRKVDLTRGRSKQPFRPIPSYYAISLGSIAKLLKISIGTAHNYKQMALEKGYIDTKNNYDEIGCIEDGKPLNLLNNLRKYNPEICNRLFIKHNKIVYQLPDLYISNVTSVRLKFNNVL